MPCSRARWSWIGRGWGAGRDRRSRAQCQRLGGPRHGAGGGRGAAGDGGVHVGCPAGVRVRVEPAGVGGRSRMKPQVSVELLKLRSANTVYLAMLADADEWAEQAAAVNRRSEPEYAGQLDHLRDQIRDAQRPDESGTPAAIRRVLAELLGEG